MNDEKQNAERYRIEEDDGEHRHDQPQPHNARVQEEVVAGRRRHGPPNPGENFNPQHDAERNLSPGSFFLPNFAGFYVYIPLCYNN